MGVLRASTAASVGLLLFLTGFGTGELGVDVTPWCKRVLWLFKQVEDIVVDFLEGRFVAICELLLRLLALVIDLGGGKFCWCWLMGNWVVVGGLQAALFNQLMLGN